MPKVSIVTPCYNSEKYIGRTIESVRFQTFTDWEHIIVDDGSRDNSAAVITSYLASDHRLKLIHQTNGGVCNARNNGLRYCSPDSEYLYFLDADDLLAKGLLEKMVAYMEARPEVGVAFCDYLCIDTDDQQIQKQSFPRYAPSRFGVRVLPDSEPNTPFASIYCWAPVMESLSLLRRVIYNQTPGWDETFGQHGEGVDLFLHFALLSEVHFIPKQLYYYRQHGSQSTVSQHKQQIQEEKLVAKWKNKAGLTSEQQSVLKAAQQFREGRQFPYACWKAGNSHLAGGHPRAALRHYLRAVRHSATYHFRMLISRSRIA